MYPVQCARLHSGNRDEDTEFLLPTKFNRSCGLVNCVHLTKIQGIKKKYRAERSPWTGILKLNWNPAALWLPSPVDSTGEWAREAGLLSRILDQSLPSAWLRSAAHSGRDCLHLQTTALQTCPGDWWNHAVGCSIINPADSPRIILLASGFISSSSTGYPLLCSFSVLGVGLRYKLNISLTEIFPSREKEW